MKANWSIKSVEKRVEKQVEPSKIIRCCLIKIKLLSGDTNERVQSRGKWTALNKVPKDSRLIVWVF